QPGALTGGLNYYRAAQVGPPAGGAAAPPTGGGAGAPGASNEAAQPALPPLVVKVPTLVIWGEKDTALLGGHLNGLDPGVEKLTVKRIPEGTHWVVRENAPEVNRLIREYVATR